MERFSLVLIRIGSKIFHAKIIFIIFLIQVFKIFSFDIGYGARISLDYGSIACAGIEVPWIQSFSGRVSASAEDLFFVFRLHWMPDVEYASKVTLLQKLKMVMVILLDSNKDILHFFYLAQA